jgi:hypothetical protein
MSRRLKPNKVHGRQLEEVREEGPDGQIVYHHRTVDTLGKMLKAGTITPEMHDAAKDFEVAFIVANLDPIRALPIVRVTGTGREPDLNERQLDARRRVHKALQAMGWPIESGRFVRLARPRPAAQRARVGDAPGLGRTARAARASAGDPGCGARYAGSIPWVREDQAGLLKEACAVLHDGSRVQKAEISSD